MGVFYGTGICATHAASTSASKLTAWMYRRDLAVRMHGGMQGESLTLCRVFIVVVAGWAQRLVCAIGTELYVYAECTSV